MATTLQKLRKEAGYRTAKDFAEAIDVPPTTYARYEQSPEKIPLKQAWMIADFLNCSIDAVVGREHIDIEAMRGDAQKFYDSVSEDSRKLIDEFFSFIVSREENAKRERQAAKNRSDEKRAEKYFRMFERDDDMVANTFFCNEREKREFYQEFVTAQIAAEREAKVEKMVDTALEREKHQPSFLPDFAGIPGEPGYEEELAEYLTDSYNEYYITANGTDEEVIEDIMAAYDRLHPEASRRTSWAVVKLQ